MHGDSKRKKWRVWERKKGKKKAIEKKKENV